MLKNNSFRKITMATLSLLIILIVWLFPTMNKEKEKNIVLMNSLKTPIYLIDKNNYVSRILVLKNGNTLKENIKNVIESLTINSKNSMYLPDGFFAIIPENTKIRDLEIENKILKINFSKELLNVAPKLENKMLESIIYSLTEFDEIDKVMIFVEKERLLKLPNSDTTLPILLDRSYGINKVYDITSLKNASKTTTYYMAKYNDYSYYVPVTVIDNVSVDKVQVIIKNLQVSPIYQTNLNSYLVSSANLENYEILEDVINLSFNNDLIANMNDINILEEVKYSIFLSLRDSYNIKSVIFEIPNQSISVIN